MPTDIESASTGHSELMFPDELEGIRFRILETRLYDADEVQDEIDDDDTPRFGRWLPADVDGHDDQKWLCCPGELIEELQSHGGAEGGQLWKVSRCEKTGDGETDHYEVNAFPDS